MGRRGFLAGATAFAATAVVVRGTEVAAQARPHRIDVHHHISPPVSVDALKKAKLDSPPVNSWTPQRSLDDMDKAGVATAITSPTQPAIGFLGAQDAAAVARASNEYARKLAQEHPGRFGVFALLPMPHVDETLKEIEYAFDVLKVDGVAFLTSYGARHLGDPAFAPVMDELQRRKAAAYSHPENPECCRNLAGVPPVVIEFGTDTTRTIASLIFSGTSKRCPDVNFIFSHAGGTVTALTERFAVQLIRNPAFKSWTTEAVMGELRRFHYDTAQAANPIAMAALTKMVQTSQIVFGSDYPYRTSQEHVSGLAEIFGADDLKKIERDNALRMMPTLRT
jgi:predicted TIM-barrel fold metal-dependent hydrolase